MCYDVEKMWNMYGTDSFKAEKGPKEDEKGDQRKEPRWDHTRAGRDWPQGKVTTKSSSR